MYKTHKHSLLLKSKEYSAEKFNKLKVNKLSEIVLNKSLINNY